MFRRLLISKARNVCSSRWVLRWKLINGIRAIKARLTIRGYEDNEDTSTFASTATRWSQRIVCSFAVLNGWSIWISDVSTAFLQSDTFAKLAEDSGTEARHVCLRPPKGYEAEFNKLEGLEDCNWGLGSRVLAALTSGLRP